LAAVLVAGLAGAASAQHIDIATVAPQGSTWMNVFDQARQDVEDATDLRVTVNYYPDGVLGDELFVVQQMDAGMVTGASLTIVGLEAIDPHIRVLELPMMFADEDEADYVVARMWPYFQQRFEQRGYILGPYATTGFAHLMSEHKIATIADLQSSIVWRWAGSTAFDELLDQMQVGNTLELPATMLSEAISQRTINACYGSPIAALSFQWQATMNYISPIRLSFGLGATVVRKDLWDTIGKQDRATITQIVNKAAKRLRREVQSDNNAAAEQLDKAGMKTAPPTTALTAAFVSAADNAWTLLEGLQFTASELGKVLEHRTKYRSMQTATNYDTTVSGKGFGTMSGAGASATD
jgi:TRAP-type C4-dicarboxylate transport system substrate-binding protein